MEAKRHSKINVFLARFLESSGNIDGIATGLRVGCDCHTFSSRPPRAAAYYQRILYKNKQRQHSLQDLARLGPLARRIQALRAFRRAEIVFDVMLFESCVGEVAVAMTVASIFYLSFGSFGVSF